ncbi:phosphopantetheine adenylyltransferase [Chromatium weissei]|nr:phosphopantetheine adenylyltransferase [Chromatium weissei]
MKEYDFEPVRGLPEQLPSGEEVLWQGAPRWMALAQRAFHIRAVALYFAVLVVWRIAADWSADSSVASALLGVSWIVVLGLLAIGALTLLGWAMARATVYTITNQRVVMRVGVAIQMMMNLPFKQIRSADLRRYADGTGDIPLLLAETAHPSYIIFWPHTRPWHFSPPQPMLRAIPDAEHVATILADALKTYLEQHAADSHAAISNEDE